MELNLGFYEILEDDMLRVVEEYKKSRNVWRVFKKE